MHVQCQAFGQNCQELINNLLDSEERENNLVQDNIAHHVILTRHNKGNTELQGWIPQYHDLNKQRYNHKSTSSTSSSSNQPGKKASSTSTSNLPFHRLNIKPSIDYKFHHFQQSERYIEQYREDHTIGLNRLDVKQDDENILRQHDANHELQKHAKEKQTFDHQLSLYKHKNGNPSPHQQHEMIISDSIDETTQSQDRDQPEKKGTQYYKKFGQSSLSSSNPLNDSYQFPRSHGNPRYNVKSIPSTAAISTSYFRPLSKRNQLRNSSNHFKSITKTALQSRNKYPPNGLQAAVPTSFNGTSNATPRQLLNNCKQAKAAAPVQMVTKVNNRNRVNKITLIYRDIPSVIIS